MWCDPLDVIGTHIRAITIRLWTVKCITRCAEIFISVWILKIIHYITPMAFSYEIQFLLSFSSFLYKWHDERKKKGGNSFGYSSFSTFFISPPSYDLHNYVNLCNDLFSLTKFIYFFICCISPYFDGYRSCHLQ